MTGQMERTTGFCVRATKGIFNKNQNRVRICFWFYKLPIMTELAR